MTAPVYEIESSFDPSVIHSSSVQALSSCGVAFKMRYIDHLPEERSGSAALFGLVIHRALEWWALDRSLALQPLVQKAWDEMVEGTALAGFLSEYKSLSLKAIAEEQKIRDAWAAQGKESKAPRMTKAWKESEVAIATRSLIGRFMAVMEKSAWRFTESDPLPALYDESMTLALTYEARWRHLRPALRTEFKFMVPWRGFTLKGTIDSIEQQYGPRGEPIATLVTDYKSYRREPSPLKDYRQGVMYHTAVAGMIRNGELPEINPRLPLYIGFDYCRWMPSWETTGPRRYFQFGVEDLNRLEYELGIFKGQCERGEFLPAQKGYDPDWCPYPSQCCLKNTRAAGGQAIEVEVRL